MGILCEGKGSDDDGALAGKHRPEVQVHRVRVNRGLLFATTSYTIIQLGVNFKATTGNHPV